MQIIVKGKNIEMTEALRDYAEEKVGRLERYLDRAIKAEVELFVEKNPKIKEMVTLPGLPSVGGFKNGEPQDLVSITKEDGFRAYRFHSPKNGAATR